MSHPQAGGPAALGSTFAGALDPGAALAWSLTPELILPLAALSGLYAVGGWRLARRGPRARPAWRLAAGAAGLLALAAALLTPVATLGHFLFSAHMTQHMLLMAVAAPLLLLADPLPAVLWALPRPLRIRLGRWLTGRSPLRAGWERLTSVPAAALVYATVLWAWHHPWAYEAALAGEWVHHLEHLSFFGAAVVFWWPVIGPAPRARRPASHGLRIGHVVVAALHGSVLSMLLAWSPRVLYETYAAAPRVAALMPLEDQALGGVIMWAGTSTVDMLTILALVWRFLAALERPAGAAPAELGAKQSRERRWLRANELRRDWICPLADKSCPYPASQWSGGPVSAGFSGLARPLLLPCLGDGTEAHPCGRRRRGPPCPAGRHSDL